MVAVASGGIAVGGDNLTGSYASYCFAQNWGSDGPSDMQSVRYATVVTGSDNVSDELYFYSDENCSSLIAYSIQAWDNVSIDNGSNGEYPVSATMGVNTAFLNTASGADWLNNFYSGWSNWTDQGDISVDEYRTLAGGPVKYNRWLIDNASSNSAASDNLSLRRSWWRTNQSDVDDPSNQPELYRVSTGDSASSRYTDNGTGTVTDNQHHLTWQQQDDGVGRNWSDAAAYCSSLSLAGYSDWWLPSKYQLVSLVDSSYSYPTINTNYFLNTQSTYYWSSTDHYFETPNAWAVGFDYGSTNDSSKTSNKLARCVRTGP
jgi:hypothetical protein